MSVYTCMIIKTIRDRIHKKGPNGCFYYSKIYLDPLKHISKIGQSTMELQWPEFLIMHTFQLHASILMLLYKNS